VRPEGFYPSNIPVTPSGIESSTFRLVAQCLNQLRHRVPGIVFLFPTVGTTAYRRVVPPCFSLTCLRQARTAHKCRERLLTEKGETMGNKWAIEFCDSHGNCKYFLHAAKLRLGPDGFTYTPHEFFARKIRRLRPGLNSRTWVPEASALTTRPPKPLICALLMDVFYHFTVRE
jgi:hypothetical protein